MHADDDLLKNSKQAGKIICIALDYLTLLSDFTDSFSPFLTCQYQNSCLEESFMKASLSECVSHCVVMPHPTPPFPKFLEGATIEVDQIHTHMRPLLMMLGDYRSLTLNVVNRLTSVTRLFPNSFNDKFCDQMMVSYWHITRHYSSLSLLVLSGIYSEMSRRSYYICVTFRLCFSQQHLRKWMEVVVLTHKGGQRSDGSVSASGFPFACIRLQQG